MHPPSGIVHITKIAAASRQLDAAIRMFFAKEDELAIHTVASAAFRILRDVTKKRGKNFTADVLSNGIYKIAREYAEGKLPLDKLKLFENTPVMAVIEKIAENVRQEGNNFDRSRIDILVGAASEQRAWPSKAANFLKHADHDAQDHLAVDEIKNENVLIGACIAYLQLMRTPTPEIVAFAAFWAAKNDTDANIGDDQGLCMKLKSVDESARYALCAGFIRDARSTSSKR
jgi:hypothetical protein